MKYYFIIGIIIGVFLIISSLNNLRKLKGKIKTKAIITGYHTINGRDERVTRIEFSVNGVKRECNLNFYTPFYKKNKKINVYYNPNKYLEVDLIQGIILTIIFGLIFLIPSLYIVIFC